MGEPMARKPARDFVSYQIGHILKSRLVRQSERTGVSAARITRIALSRLLALLEAGQSITVELEREAHEEQKLRRAKPRAELPADQLTLTGVDQVKRSKK